MAGSCKLFKYVQFIDVDPLSWHSPNMVVLLKLCVMFIWRKENMDKN